MPGEDNNENGRVGYLREDLQEMRKEMQVGFQDLSSKIDSTNSQLTSENKDMVDRCRENRREIYKQLNERKEEIQGLDKKFFRLYLIGNGVGFILGVIVTASVYSYFGG